MLILQPTSTTIQVQKRGILVIDHQPSDSKIVVYVTATHRLWFGIVEQILSP